MGRNHESPLDVRDRGDVSGGDQIGDEDVAGFATVHYGIKEVKNDSMNYEKRKPCRFFWHGLLARML